MISRGWYRPERSYELEIETDTPSETIDPVLKLLNQERISHMLMGYDRVKKSDSVKVALALGVPEDADTEKLTVQMLGLGVYSVSWRLARDQ